MNPAPHAMKRPSDTIKSTNIDQQSQSADAITTPKKSIEALRAVKDKPLKEATAESWS